MDKMEHKITANQHKMKEDIVGEEVEVEEEGTMTKENSTITENQISSPNTNNKKHLNNQTHKYQVAQNLKRDNSKDKKLKN